MFVDSVGDVEYDEIKSSKEIFYIQIFLLAILAHRR